MRDQLYKAVEIKDGNSTEPVQYVGVYALNWQREWGEPEWGFIEHDTPQQPSGETPVMQPLKYDTNNLIIRSASQQPSDSAGEEVNWDDIEAEFWERFQGVASSHQAIFNWIKLRLKKLTRPTVSEEEIEVKIGSKWDYDRSLDHSSRAIGLTVESVDYEKRLVTFKELMPYTAYSLNYFDGKTFKPH